MSEVPKSIVETIINSLQRHAVNVEISFNQLYNQLEEIKKMPLSSAAADYVHIKNFVDDYEKMGKVITEVRDLLKTQILPNMFDRDKITSFNTSNGYRVGVSISTRASMTDKLNGMKWLKENGLADIVSETVNASTLSATAKTLLEEGKELDPEFFNVYLQPTTSVTKVAKK